MAKLDRKDVKIFAENSKETLITEFRTEDSEGNTASFSRDPDVIQNGNYSQGWVNDTNNLNTKIYGEDLNAVNYVLSYLLKYLYENGIAEWKSTTTYYTNSIVKVGDKLYRSLQDNNTNNNPENTVSYWDLIPLENVSIDNSGTGFSVVKNVTGNTITFKTISVTGYGEITDNGDQLNIDIAGGGGGGGGDTYWGMIHGTITNQTDLISLINLKQDIFTVDSPLVLTDEQHLTINKATSSVSGYLDATDFATFNGKQDTISATLPISITNNNIEIATANTSTTGALSYADWNTFNNKQDTITASSPLSLSSNTLTITKADSNNSGYLASTDWTTFNNKYNSDSTGINMYHTTDTTTIRPIVEAGYTNSNIGTSSYPFTNGYINEINVATIAGTATNPNNITISSNLNPDSTANNRNLGTSSNKFYEGWISYVKTSQLEAMAGGVKLNLGYNYMSPATADQYQLGYQNRFLYVYSLHFDQGSDIRNKSNIKDYDESVLEKIKNITPITYNYKSEERTTLGISAQELRDIEPLIVHAQETETKDGKDETLGIDVYSLCVFAIKAIKELNTKVESLEARVKELEGNKKELEK